MQIIGIVGPSDADRRALLERLVTRLAERGEVATVGSLEGPDADGSSISAVANATASYRVAGDGSWIATERESSIDRVLDRLAPRYDYAVLDGFDEATVPRVEIGDRAIDDGTTDDTEGAIDGAPEAVLATGSDADAIDVEDLLETIETCEPYETLESLVERVKRSPRSERAGAIATFTGRVRVKDGADDPPTERLQFEKYEGVADRRMETIREELESREGVYEVRMHHRTGVVEAEEDIVHVVVLAGHRREAFRTVEDGIDRLKAEVPLFKKEVTVEGEFWAHQHEC